MMTFREIQQSVQRFVGPDDPQTLDIIRSEINIAYGDLANERDWRELWVPYDASVTLTANQGYLALPQNCARVKRIFNKTSDFELFNKEFGQLLEESITLVDQTGQVLQFTELGLRAQMQPLTAATTALEVVSNNAADTYGSIRLRGIQTTTLTYVKTEVTPNGTSAVIYSAANFPPGWPIESISTDYTYSGIISVRVSGTPTTIIGRIAPGEKQSLHYIVLLNTLPDAADSLYVVYKRLVRPMTDDDDYPMIPVDTAIVEMVKGRMRQSDRQYQQAREHFALAANSVNAAFSQNKRQGNVSLQSRPDYRGRGMRRAY